MVLNGRIRHIYIIGLYNSQFPDWIPKQYCWFYSYITSPLANVNYTTLVIPDVDFTFENIINYIYKFLPLGISKRLPVYESLDGVLIVPWFNVSSIYGGYYQTLGSCGIIFGGLIQVLMVLIGCAIVRHSNVRFIYCILVSVVMIFAFFTNSFSYPLMCYPVIFVMLMSFFIKK